VTSLNGKLTTVEYNEMELVYYLDKVRKGKSKQFPVLITNEYECGVTQRNGLKSEEPWLTRVITHWLLGWTN
jgi:hypothetical protein